MNTDKLVRMVNQIADFFVSYPAAEAKAGVHDHIVSFWTPRMVTALRDRAATDPAGLSPLALAALAHQDDAESPVEKVTAGPKELGTLTSDAG